MRFCTLLLTGLLLACDSPTSIPRGVQVHADLDPGIAAASDAIHLDVTVRNESDHAYHVHGSNACLAILEVRREDGRRVVWGDPRTCDMASVRHLLAPAGELVDRLPVTRLTGAPLEPGEYRVRAAIHVAEHGRVWSGAARLVIGDGERHPDD